MTMLEQVARAIAKDQHGTADAVGELERQTARAAIAAMREPTDEMVAAADKLEKDLGPFGTPKNWRWQAMIDAALSEAAQ